MSHSLGGLVRAQVIVPGGKTDARDSVSKVAHHVKGMVFLATPFGGTTIPG